MNTCSKKEFKESGKIILKSLKKNDVDVKGRAEQVQAIDALTHKLGILRKNLLMYEGVSQEVVRSKGNSKITEGTFRNPDK